MNEEQEQPKLDEATAKKLPAEESPADESPADRTKRFGYAVLNASFLFKNMEYGIGFVTNVPTRKRL